MEKKDLIHDMEMEVNNIKKLIESIDTMTTTAETLLEQNEIMVDCLGKAVEQISSIYSMLNSFARGDHMKQWSRTDPQAILGEVYFKLAPVFLSMVGALRKVGVNITLPDKDSQ